MTFMTGHPDVEKSHFGHPQPFEQEQTEVTEGTESGEGRMNLRRACWVGGS